MQCTVIFLTLCVWTLCVTARQLVDKLALNMTRISCSPLNSISDAPEFEFCMVTAKFLIECAAADPLLAEVIKQIDLPKEWSKIISLSILSQRRLALSSLIQL